MNLADLMNAVEDSDEDMPRSYHSGKGVARKQENREFIAWDGEGITPDDETQQNYVLFGNSKGYYVTASEGSGISTVDCLELLLQTERDYPLGIHFGYGFSYDVEMILKDIPLGYIRSLKSNGFVRWNGYRIEFRKNKWFAVSINTETEHVVCKVWDVLSFFGCGLIQALEDTLGDKADLELIKHGKANRRLFVYAEMDSVIIPYWRTELSQMVAMMTELRKRFYNAGFRITNWHGPGALATYEMTRRKVKQSMATIPEAIGEVSRFAYAGGRFELFKIGYHHEKVYSYDIRSAYPSAIRYLPNLTTGTWEHVIAPKEIAPFGVYRIKFTHSRLMATRPMPFYYRDYHSAVHFPNVVEGWYWSPEAALTNHVGNDAEILEGWIYHATDERPFSWIEETYDLRMEWKAAGNPSQIALKLLMNSMYGKFAQRVGYKGKDSPTWHQLEWAGYITSHCRARLFRAMMEAHGKRALIAVETDGIFTSEPLSHLLIGKGLGEWEYETYDSLIYLQSGFYFKRQNGKWIARSRGFDPNSITVEDAIAALGKWRPWQDEAPLGQILGTSTRFTTMGQYLTYHNPEAWRRTWTTSARALNLGTDGKRVHRPLFCSACSQGMSPVDVLHDMTIYSPVGGHTYPHILPWIDKVDNRSNLFRTIDDGIML